MSILFIQKHKIKISIIAFIIFFCLSATYLSKPKSIIYKNIPIFSQNALFKVMKVLDGDTFEISVNDKIFSVRMMGIDTPETVDPRKPVQCFGKEASDMNKNLISSTNVRLKIDKNIKSLDKYNRILAYVYREDGLFVNKFLLENGYAREYTFSNQKYEMQTEFKKMQKEAKKNKRGLWGDICNEATTYQTKNYFAFK